MIKALALLQILNFALGASVDFTRRDDHIFVRGDSCEAVTSVTQSLAEWTKNEGGKETCPIQSQKPQQLENGICEFDISSCVPNHVLKYQGVLPKLAGPNCWNLALVMKGILPALRYTTGEEMAFYMKPPLCRQLINEEPKMPGDIGAIEKINKDGIIEDHGFIYISEDVAYSKNGYQPAYPYELQPLEKVFDTYDVPNKKECRENRLNTSGECKNSVSYFRCQSMTQYLKEHKDVPQKISTSLKKIGMFEACLQQQAFNGGALSEKSKRNIVDTANALNVYLNEQMNTKPDLGIKDPEERSFILGTLELRLQGIEAQLMNTDDKDMTAKMKLLYQSVEKSANELQKASH